MLRPSRALVGPAAASSAGGGRARVSGPLTAALSLLAFASAAVVVGQVSLVLTGDPGVVMPLLVFVAVAVEYLLAGLFAWARRPANGTGPLLVVGGYSLLGAVAANLPLTPVALAGAVAPQLPLAVIFHLVLAFPSGRLSDRAARRLVVAGYVVSVVPRIVQLPFSGNPQVPAWLRLPPSPELVQVVGWGQSVAGAVVVALAVRLLVARVRRGDPSTRRGLAALYLYGALTFAVIVLAVNVLQPLLGLDDIQVFFVQILALAGIPVAFVTGILRGGFARTRRLDELVTWLADSDATRPTLRDALRRTLGDPSLEVLFWLAERGGFVDDTGAVVVPPRSGSRATADVVTASGRVGAIVYDAVLLDAPEPVRAAARVIGLALERERLTAELRASSEALRESRARLVQSADGERRRIVRDLHDGLQGRLVVLGLRAGQVAARLRDGPETADVAADVVAMRTDLEAAIADLRRLVQGVLPDLLIQRGLPAALDELLDQVPLATRLTVTGDGPRPPAAAESAGYFVVAEAIANAVKHSGANELQVVLDQGPDVARIEVRDDGTGGARLDSGSGLRGLVDRVEAVGGRLDLHSPAGAGTRVTVELPCGS